MGEKSEADSSTSIVVEFVLCVIFLLEIPLLNPLLLLLLLLFLLFLLLLLLLLLLRVL